MILVITIMSAIIVYLLGMLHSEKEKKNRKSKKNFTESIHIKDIVNIYFLLLPLIDVDEWLIN